MSCSIRVLFLSYVLACDGIVKSSNDLKTLISFALKTCPNSARVIVVRGDVVLNMSVEELRALITMSKEEKIAEKKIAVVFDQMFKGFAEIVYRELGSPPILEAHEIVGRGMDKPRIVRGVILEPARDDYDVLKLLERLKSEGKIVVLFTGDRSLANQAETLGVKVEYMPPGEFGGKETVIREMINKVKRLIE